MGDIRLRQFEGYEYHDAAAFLKALREIEPMIVQSGLSYQVRSLHTRKLRPTHEQRQAALFAHGMAGRLPEFRFSIACVEEQDYDAVIRWHNDRECLFTPIQLKEFVPQHLNTDATLEEILNDLKKYTQSSDLVVVVFLNRRFALNLQTLPPLKLNLGGLYFVGAAKQDQSEWVLIGDLLNEPAISTFSYPA